MALRPSSIIERPVPRRVGSDRDQVADDRGDDCAPPLLRAPTAMPMPMPVKAVKNGWANGPKTHRTMNRPTAPPIPPA